MNIEKNCQSCKYYKDGYCENLELKPNYPEKACDYFNRQKEMTHIDAMGFDLEEQLNNLIENAVKEEDKERFKALKVLANYYHPSQICTSMDNFADGRYDLTISFIGCCRKFYGGM